jgi:hypothetical protein
MAIWHSAEQCAPSLLGSHIREVTNTLEERENFEHCDFRSFGGFWQWGKEPSKFTSFPLQDCDPCWLRDETVLSHVLLSNLGMRKTFSSLFLFCYPRIIKGHKVEGKWKVVLLNMTLNRKRSEWMYNQLLMLRCIFLSIYWKYSFVLKGNTFNMCFSFCTMCIFKNNKRDFLKIAFSHCEGKLRRHMVCPNFKGNKSGLIENVQSDLF